MICLNIENLSYNYGKNKVLEDLNFVLKSGEIALLVGGNGSGKSTLLRLIAGLLKPISGKISLNESSVQYVGHKSQLYHELTVRENLSFFADLASENSKSVEDIFIKLKLKNFLDKSVNELSQGMLQKVAIAKALLFNPSLLLLDEPSASLDSESVKLIKAILSEAVVEGSLKSIIIATHDELRLNDLSTAVFKMNLGKIIPAG
jgi:ABC-2 type transport system ATP-binding protein